MNYTPQEINYVRRFMLNNIHEVKRILPTEQQIKIIKLTSETLTAPELAKKIGITIPHASMQLAKLWRRGWLERSDIGNETGGTMYIYTSLFGESES